MPHEVRTACTRDCPDACQILATVEDGRITRLRGDPAHPVTRGFLCYRTDHYLERQYSAERLTQPLIRRGSQLVPATWDEALDRVAGELLAARDQHGPESILSVRSGGSLGMLKMVNRHFFELLGPVTHTRGDICSGAGEAAQKADMGVSDAHDLEDLEHSRAIVLWGKNVAETGVHLMPVLKRARARGVPIVQIDPVHNARTLQLCDRVLPGAAGRRRLPGAGGGAGAARRGPRRPGRALVHGGLRGLRGAGAAAIGRGVGFAGGSAGLGRARDRGAARRGGPPPSSSAGASGGASTGRRRCACSTRSAR